MQPLRHSNLHGILAMVAALGVFILGDSASKFALAEVPMFEAICSESITPCTVTPSSARARMASACRWVGGLESGFCVEPCPTMRSAALSLVEDECTTRAN